MRTRDEHIAECKRYALGLLERGEVREAFTAMLSDLNKHPETVNHPGGTIGVGLMLIPGWIDNPREVRHWIEGFR